MSKYEPTWESLDSHEVPEWYHDAKLGIFVVWGVYSVPAWAPKDLDIGEAVEDGLSDSPYAEWYPYFMYLEDSQTYDYHREHYGEDVEYDDFIAEWTAENWDPEEWADLFAGVGANYVVMIAEHHDGFAGWDSHYTKYNSAEMGPERDIVGEFAGPVRDRGMKYSPSYHANLNYYQPGFEGLFGHPDYRGERFRDGNDNGPGPEYVDFMNAKHRELIRKYEPDLLWFDVPMADSDHVRDKDLIAEYYNRAAEEWDKEVAVNDRSSTTTLGLGSGVSNDDSEQVGHGDFVTPEYQTFDEIQDRKWESCRGIGRSFSYNAAEGPDDHLTVEELVHSFVDIVSKNGNLLLSIGPKADGTIPDIQRERLQGFGEWVTTNDEAIFGTRPWAVAEDDASDVEVRYTWKDDTLYAIALEWPGDELTLSFPEHVDVSGSVEATLLSPGGGVDCTAEIDGDQLQVSLPESPPEDHPGHAYAVALDDVPNSDD
jgi:alpha-L-fucosidase